MEDAVLGLVMAVFFVSGFFVMDRFGRYMDEVYRSSRHPAAGHTKVILTEEKSPFEIEKEIETFRNRYGRNAAVVFIPEDSDLYDSFAKQTDSDENSCL